MQDLLKEMTMIKNLVLEGRSKSHFKQSDLREEEKQEDLDN